MHLFCIEIFEKWQGEFKNMARIIREKELIHTRLAANYGGWTYCTECGENIGYLCYATYDKVDFQYECSCGSQGRVMINFEDSMEGSPCEDGLILVKNRLCCPKDQSPLITVLTKKLNGYSLAITCKACGSIFQSKDNGEIK